VACCRGRPSWWPLERTYRIGGGCGLVPAASRVKDMKLLPVLNATEYFAGDDGVVYSIRSGQIRPLKPFLKKSNRPAVGIYDKSRYVHLVVCEAFYGPRPDGMVVRHLDGNSFNNIPSNLCWGTREENVQDDLRHGKRIGKCHRRITGLLREYLRHSDLSTNELSRATGFTVDSVRRARRSGGD
jgi:HNH endonuclease